jgi:putative ABC transport system permease protein
MSGLLSEIRCALRVLARSPMATLVALAALALGIGVNTASFSGVRAIVLRPFPFADLDRIVRVWDTEPKRGSTQGPVSAPDFLAWHQENRSFERMAAVQTWDASLGQVADPEQLDGYAVSPQFFSLLGMQPAIGRMFSSEEEQPGRDQVVVLSHGFWEQRFSSDPGVVGKNLSLNGRPYTVVGVMPAEFDYPMGSQIWKPLAFTAEQRTDRQRRALQVLARLAPGVTFASAEAELKSIAARVEREYPDSNQGHAVSLARLRDVTNLITDRFSVLGLLGSMFVLLLACANIANVLLARAASRQTEIAVRMALGAGRWRLARPFLAESLILALVGGALGLLLGLWWLDLLRANITPQAIREVAGLRQIGFDWTVLCFTGATATATGLLCGLAPAMRAMRSSGANDTLKGGGRGSVGSRGRLRDVLVISEVALALVLLVAASLVVSAYRHMATLDVGYNPKNLLTMRISLPEARYASAQAARQYFDRAVSRLETLPQAKAAAAMGWGPQVKDLRIEGQPFQPAGTRQPDLKLVTPHYFAAMGLRVLKGRSFNGHDAADPPARAVVLSESVARRFFTAPGDPLGASVILGGSGLPSLTLVGIVADTKDSFWGELQPAVYVLSTHLPRSSMQLLLRTAGDPLGVAATARAEVQALDPNQPIYALMSAEQNLRDLTAGVRTSASMMSVYAVLALLLAASGIYGVISCSVAQRTQEIGVRIAVGAETRDVLRLVVGESFLVTSIGLTLGLAAAWGLTRLMSSLLYGVIAVDAWTFLGVSLLLATAAFLAAYLPARRAAKVDPMVALRCE